MNKGLIYLIQPSELVGTKRYKIGMSNNLNLDRCKNGFKKGSRYICIMECIEPLILEGNIKKQFNEKFKLIAGNEYYEGNEKDILNTFNNLVMEYNNSYVINKKIDKINKFDYVNLDKDEIDIDKIKEEFENYKEDIEFGRTKKINQYNKIYNNVIFSNENITLLYNKIYNNVIFSNETNNKIIKNQLYFNSLEKNTINKFIRFNNTSYIIKIYANEIKYSSTLYYLSRYFDVLDKIIIIIKKNNDEIIDIKSILNINLIINYKTFIMKIEDYNINYQDDKLIIINFNLNNFIKFDNIDIGGLPLFLFDQMVKIIINFKKKMFNFDEKMFNFNEKINMYIGGFMIISNFIKKMNITLPEEIFNKIENLSLGNKKEVFENLKFYDPNDKSNYEIKKYLDSKLLDYLNLILYNKNILYNQIIYNLELEQETSHLVFTLNYEVIDKINFIIRINDNDIFNEDIYTLYYEGYFIFKFNSKILSDLKIKLIILKKLDANISIQEIDNNIEMKIFNILDIFN